MFGFLQGIYDSIVRKVSSSFLLKYLDGYKTPIMRTWQAINLIMEALYMVCVFIPDYQGINACGLLDLISLKLILLSNMAQKIGLELAVQDRGAKQRIEIKSVKRVEE